MLERWSGSGLPSSTWKARSRSSSESEPRAPHPPVTPRTMIRFPKSTGSLVLLVPRERPEELHHAALKERPALRVKLLEGGADVVRRERRGQALIDLRPPLLAGLRIEERP